MRHYYATYDTFLGILPKDYNAGFANTKSALAFTSTHARDEYIKNTKLTNVQPLTRRQAFSYIAPVPEEHMAELYYNEHCIGFSTHGDKRIPIVTIDWSN